MNPKEDTNVMDGTLYFVDESGEFKPITVIRNAELSTDTDLEDIVPEEYRLPTVYNLSFSLGNVPQHCLKLWKLIKVNNYRRLHGLKPIRCKAWRHKHELSMFALNRRRRGCYKKW